MQGGARHGPCTSPPGMKTWLYLVLVLALYVNFRTPDPDLAPVRCRPIVPWSHLMLAPAGTSRSPRLLPNGARRGLFLLPPRDRARCWALFKIIIHVFRYTPEHRASLERVLRSYQPAAQGRGSCTVYENDRLIAPKGDRSL